MLHTAREVEGMSALAAVGMSVLHCPWPVDGPAGASSGLLTGPGDNGSGKLHEVQHSQEIQYIKVYIQLNVCKVLVIIDIRMYLLIS